LGGIILPNRHKEAEMFFEASIAWGLLSLVFGVLILVFPKLLSYFAGAYLIIIGLVIIIGAFF